MKKNTSIIRIIKAFAYSMVGLKAVWKNEAAFRQELILAIILIPLTFLLSNNNIERVILIIPIFIVLIVEIINSAIENCIDRISTEIHILSKLAKDMGSASVFVSLILLIVVWLIILT